jgi:uncharacterized coiled-coil DUF342 family protein
MNKPPPNFISPEELAEWVKRKESHKARFDALTTASIETLRKAGEARLKLERGEKMTEDDLKRLGMSKKQ